MDSKQIFTLYLQTKARQTGHPWRAPKNWEKIMQRKDWPAFERLAATARSTMALVDLEDFFKANFEARGGKFGPHQFFHKNSFMFYNRWKKLPKREPEINQVATSLKFIVSFCKSQNISVKEYFDVDMPYPHVLRHFQSGKLHRWIFTYYAHKINTFIFREMPVDIVEHAMGHDAQDQSDIWWMQLINDDKANSLVTGFFERII